MADVSFNNIPSNKNVINFFQNVFSETSSKSGFLNLLPPVNTHSSNINIEKKSLENAMKLLDKCKKLYQSSKLNLKNSPPFLIGTLSDIQLLLNNVIFYYKEKVDELLGITYFKVMLFTIINQSEGLIKLFKDEKDRILQISSPARKRLTKLSLIFSHVYKTFNEFFQRGFYCVENFRITKLDAAQWWKVNFNDKTIISWKKFYESLSQTYKLSDLSQSIALKSTINLCCNNYVTMYEFDVFVRLFQPWNNILETWKALAVLHPGFMSFMTYDDVKLVLMNFIDNPGPGTYVFRSSCTKLGQWAIGYITEDKQILQTIIQNKSLARALLDGEKEGYYKYPNGSTTYNAYQHLYSLVHNLTQTHIQVSHEQYKVYCEMDSTFELCKICSENDKNIRLEPCQHLLCRPCLVSWELSSGLTCPFCRLEIKSVEDIIVKPYDLKDFSEKLSAPPLPPRPVMSTSTVMTNSDIDLMATSNTELNYAILDFPVNYSSTTKATQVNFITTSNSSCCQLENSDSENDLERNLKILVESENIDVKVAELVLKITDNDISKSRTILKYFKIKDDIIF